MISMHRTSYITAFLLVLLPSTLLLKLQSSRKLKSKYRVIGDVEYEWYVDGITSCSIVIMNNPTRRRRTNNLNCDETKLKNIL